MKRVLKWSSVPILALVLLISASAFATNDGPLPAGIGPSGQLWANDWFNQNALASEYDISLDIYHHFPQRIAGTVGGAIVSNATYAIGGSPCWSATATGDPIYYADVYQITVEEFGTYSFHVAATAESGAAQPFLFVAQAYPDGSRVLACADSGYGVNGAAGAAAPRADLTIDLAGSATAPVVYYVAVASTVEASPYVLHVMNNKYSFGYYNYALQTTGYWDAVTSLDALDALYFATDLLWTDVWGAETQASAPVVGFFGSDPYDSLSGSFTGQFAGSGAAIFPIGSATYDSALASLNTLFLSLGLEQIPVAAPDCYTGGANCVAGTASGACGTGAGSDLIACDLTAVCATSTGDCTKGAANWPLGTTCLTSGANEGQCQYYCGAADCGAGCCDNAGTVGGSGFSAGNPLNECRAYATPSTPNPSDATWNDRNCGSTAGQGGTTCTACTGITPYCYNGGCEACDANTCPHGCCDSNHVCRVMDDYQQAGYLCHGTQTTCVNDLDCLTAGPGGTAVSCVLGDSKAQSYLTCGGGALYDGSAWVAHPGEACRQCNVLTGSYTDLTNTPQTVTSQVPCGHGICEEAILTLAFPTLTGYSVCSGSQDVGWATAATSDLNAWELGSIVPLFNENGGSYTYDGNPLNPFKGGSTSVSFTEETIAGPMNGVGYPNFVALHFFATVAEPTKDESEIEAVSTSDFTIADPNGSNPDFATCKNGNNPPAWVPGALTCGLSLVVGQ
jgi:hypothetical protein